jgi:hypothetical protein
MITRGTQVEFADSLAFVGKRYISLWPVPSMWAFHGYWMGSLPLYASRVNTISPLSLVSTNGWGVGIDSSSIGGESQAGDAATESTGVADGGVSIGDTAAVESEPLVGAAVAEAWIDPGAELAVASGDAVSSGTPGLLVALAAGVVVLPSTGVSVDVSDGFAATGVSVRVATVVAAAHSSADSASLGPTSCSRSRSQAASSTPASASVKRGSDRRRISRYFR